ncbi:hypothetical protein [Halalkalibacter okhensis]|nr:hypothetical protein [Halalkalibacter okhensis]
MKVIVGMILIVIGLILLITILSSPFSSFYTGVIGNGLHPINMFNDLEIF